ncbi:MAG: MarR family transcriptional regulator [Flavobacteriaceae bacterium]|jgi:DNA-binding MarR family transcriptional regulator|nr:MarR family transcriptional regulator [Flavobacteriaceae bacterium]|tara:strand:- start:50702 stop:51151 length:450 start_codon:yes stop_codon:yes gene_type:complete
MNHQQFNKRADFVLRETWKNIEKMYNKEANLYDVTFSISFTLISIDPDIGSPSTSIGPVMGLEANSISRILNSMENKKLIYRKPNPTDGRSIIISLTKSGLKKRKIVIEKIRKFKSIIRNRIDKKDLNSFHKVINQINEIIYEGNVFID